MDLSDQLMFSMQNRFASITKALNSFIRNYSFCTLRFIFCRTHQADSGNEKQEAKHPVNNEPFNVAHPTGSINKQNGSINKTSYTQQGENGAKYPFNVHIMFLYCWLIEPERFPPSFKFYLSKYSPG